MIDIMREDHAKLRWVIFLVAVERIVDRLGGLSCFTRYAHELLWIYGEELEVLDMISKRLAEIGKEIAQVQAHFDAVCV